jgi:hypothetical protein
MRIFNECPARRDGDGAALGNHDGANVSAENTYMRNNGFIGGYPFPETTDAWFGNGISGLAAGRMQFGVLPVHNDHPSGGSTAGPAEGLAQNRTWPEGTCDGDGQANDGEE